VTTGETTSRALSGGQLEGAIESGAREEVGHRQPARLRRRNEQNVAAASLWDEAVDQAVAVTGRATSDVYVRSQLPASICYFL
jgi:hypothetical protein